MKLNIDIDMNSGEIFNVQALINVAFLLGILKLGQLQYGMRPYNILNYEVLDNKMLE